MSLISNKISNYNSFTNICVRKLELKSERISYWLALAIIFIFDMILELKWLKFIYFEMKNCNDKDCIINNDEKARKDLIDEAVSMNNESKSKVSNVLINTYKNKLCIIM